MKFQGKYNSVLWGQYLIWLHGNKHFALFICYQWKHHDDDEINDKSEVETLAFICLFYFIQLPLTLYKE